MIYRKLIKRSLDLIIALISILLLIPIYLFISLLLKVDSKGPVLFYQKRVGKEKKYFYILKYRTMRIDTPWDVPTHMLKDPDTYITRLGKFLRKTSLDELPQIINIFKGDMSFVGPRPALWNQFDLIEQRDRYNANGIQPGLTGWAQINGRDELTIENKARLDGEYVKKMGLIFDAIIIFKTMSRVINGDGIYEGKTINVEQE